MMVEAAALTQTLQILCDRLKKNKKILHTFKPKATSQAPWNMTVNVKLYLILTS